ncbi:hypothetical protein KAFR_0I00980 [Kazachstania africana CBS 2517]|uniref:RNA polymerase I-specific transcription initiation factor RRN6 n=1 Tax=Kazachstania africana (strain ATCC 22294 / BCRC 22015 / CBS 2517 / CECT 1963 / NBRC 1671 / NRRL Y-8276) TaxID=1071382 RepID=H2AZS9_KAZAF|nr:hypothetical protein KAFR_0I00980 [Kazachstania africana CBS 2517]CCF59879.1 hypothetical protein KAFR_0I00980 [Kazachstania africana CBS 2517]
MNEARLPGRRPIGAQLGVGLSGPSLYVSKSAASKIVAVADDEKWLHCKDTEFPSTFMDFKVASNYTLVNDILDPFEIESKVHFPSISQNLPADEELLESDLSDDDEKEGNTVFLNEHSKESLVSNLHWRKPSPQIISSDLQIYRNTEEKKHSMFELIDENRSESLHFDFVPKELLSNLTRSDTILEAQQERSRKLNRHNLSVIDPTVKDLFVIGNVQSSSDLRHDNEQRQIIAFSTGHSGSNLIISPLKLEPSDTEHDIYSIAGCSSVFKIDLKSKIKTIKIPTVASSLGRYSDCIIAITECSLHIIKIKSIDNKYTKIDCHVFDPLYFTELSDFPFADVAFNPWDLTQFAIIDTKGNWAIGSLPFQNKNFNGLILNDSLRGSIFDPQETSLRKKVIWSSHHTRILLMDQSKIVEVDFGLNWQSEIVQAKTWSELLDLKEMNEYFSILLTSQEIIFLRNKSHNNEITRDLSWKHNLDHNDKTYRMFIQKVDDGYKAIFFVYITSRRHKNVYMQAFTLTNNGELIRYVAEPIIFQIPQKTEGVDSIQFVEQSLNHYSPEPNAHYNINLNLFIKGTNSKAMTTLILTNNKNYDKISSYESDKWTIEGHIGRTEIENPSTEITFFIQDIVNKFEKTLTLDYNKDKELELFQQFGYHLSESMNRLLEQWEDSGSFCSQRSFTELHDLPQHFENLSEFTSLLEQFIQYYKDQELLFTDLKTISNLLLYEEVDDIDIIYNKLLQCWGLLNDDAEFLTREIVKQIVWTMLKFNKKNKYEKLSHKIRNSLGQRYKDTIDLWDMNELDDENDLEYGSSKSTVPLHSQSQHSMSSQMQIPIIKSSQNKVAKRGKSLNSRHSVRVGGSQVNTQLDNGSMMGSQLASSLPDTMTPAFSLLSAPSSQLISQPVSQVRDSQRSKKKKKKIGGFG